MGGLQPLDGLVGFSVFQEGPAHEIIHQSGNALLFGIFLLVLREQSVGIPGPSLEGIGENDLLFGRTGKILAPVGGNLPEHQASLVVFSGL